MKIPKTFKPDKNLDDKIKYLLDPEVFGNSNASPIRVQNLVIGAAKFLSEKNKISATTLDNYKLSQEIVQDIEYYNKHDVEHFARVITGHNSDRFLGDYVSALVNRIIKENEIIYLELKEPLDHLGHRLERGTLLIKGDVGNVLGYSNNGGKIIVNGCARDSVGFQMRKGLIIITGDVKDYLGFDTYGGIIRVGGDAKRSTGYMTSDNAKMVVNGDIEHIANSCRGDIMVYGKINEIGEGCVGNIYEMGKQVNP